MSPHGRKNNQIEHKPPRDLKSRPTENQHHITYRVVELDAVVDDHTAALGHHEDPSCPEGHAGVHQVRRRRCAQRRRQDGLAHFQILCCLCPGELDQRDGRRGGARIGQRGDLLVGVSIGSRRCKEVLRRRWLSYGGGLLEMAESSWLQLQAG